MDWDLIGKVLAVLAAYSASLFFGLKGGLEWRLYANSTADEADIKSKRGKCYFFGGIACFVITTIVLVTVLITGGSKREGEDPSVPTSLPTTLEQSLTEGPVYVKNQLYDGADYSGFVDSETRRPHGKGKMKYTNGNVYDGEWVHGVQQGNGLMRYRNGDIYDGKWQNGQRDGIGVYTWKDGKQYTGAYKNDMREGEGVFAGWVDLTYGWQGTYYGASKGDKFEGYGKFVFDNGDVFKGIFKADRFWNGTHTRKDGSQYEIVDGKPKG
ncbi:MAG: hypothetical protein FWH55_10995 [Oscillospiraceae bacterium]|nr:hypothetical protein [Oscillospiraceae bacterium]